MKNLVPKRRFEEFKDSDPWEHRKLGDLGSVAMNRRIFKDQTSETGEVPFYKIGTFGGKPDAYISRELFEEYKAKYPYPEVGDILISASGSIGRTVEYAGKDEYFQDSNIVWLKHDNRLNSLFLRQFYTIVEWEGLEGSTIKRLYNKNILETKISIPSLAEQTKIGIFFRSIDNLITLHQRKLDKLKETKSAYLSEMFPKDGEFYPKRRFAGFTDPWEQCKLGDIGEFKSNGVDKKINKNDFSVCLLNYMDVYNRINLTNGNRNKLMQVTATTKQIEANNIEANDVFFTPSSETADDIGRVMVVEETLENTVYSYHLMRFRPHKNIFYSIFPNYVFETTFFRKQMILEAQGVQRFVLNRDAFENLIVTMPELKEQKLISEFFRSLDNLITLHQRKLDKLQALKQAYLSEMFV